MNGAYSDSCCSGCFFAAAPTSWPGLTRHPRVQRVEMARAICKDKKLSSSKPLFHPPERSEKGRRGEGGCTPGQDGLSAKIRPHNLNQQLSLQEPNKRLL